MEAVVFVGIQGSGKSSFYQERFCRTHVRLDLVTLTSDGFAVQEWRDAV